MIYLSYFHLFAALWALSVLFAIPEWYKTIKQHHQSRHQPRKVGGITQMHKDTTTKTR